MSESKPPEEQPERRDPTPPPPMPSWPVSEKDAAASPVTKPREIRIAVILMYVGAALSVASLLSLFSSGTRQQIRSEAEKAVERQKGTPEQAEALANNTFTFIIVLGIIMIALWVFLALMNDRGKNWARLTASILAVANVFFNLQGLSFVGLALVVVGIAAVVLLWLPASRPWFDGSRKVSA
ncbi:hypothetical protein ABN034_19890 [Actinopolymorpha sp. B11F2]|uniref:hypothetical protein n=1 Tax=Actinopolymorpha sp. B11F2 TaxID=3160862 RepID=UPI0032E376AE